MARPPRRNVPFGPARSAACLTVGWIVLILWLALTGRLFAAALILIVGANSGRFSYERSRQSAYGAPDHSHVPVCKYHSHVWVRSVSHCGSTFVGAAGIRRIRCRPAVSELRRTAFRQRSPADLHVRSGILIRGRAKLGKNGGTQDNPSVPEASSPCDLGYGEKTRRAERAICRDTLPTLSLDRFCGK